MPSPDRNPSKISVDYSQSRVPTYVDWGVIVEDTINGDTIANVIALDPDDAVALLRAAADAIETDEARRRPYRP